MIRDHARDDTTSIIALVSGGHFLSHVYLLAYPPLFPLLQSEFSLSTARLGLLVTAIYIPTLLFQIPVGELVDRLGAKRVLVAGLMVTSLGITLSGFAYAYPLLLAMAFLSGLGQSTYHPANYALLGVVTDRESSGKAFSLHTFGGYVGFAVAPVAIGGLGALYGWQPALVVVGAVGFIYAVLLQLEMAPVYATTLEGSRSSSRTDDTVDEGDATNASIMDTLSPLFKREMMFVFLFYLVSMMAVVGLQSFTTVFAVDSLGLDQSAANTVLTAFLVAMAVGVIGGGPLADRLPVHVVVIGTFVLSAVGVWASIASVRYANFAVVMAIFSFVGVLIGAALPSRDKLANSVTDPGSTGKSFGFYFTGLSLGAVISPALLGLIIDYHSIGAAYLLIGVFLIVAAAIVGLTIRDARRAAANAPA